MGCWDPPRYGWLHRRQGRVGTACAGKGQTSNASHATACTAEVTRTVVRTFSNEEGLPNVLEATAPATAKGLPV